MTKKILIGAGGLVLAALIIFLGTSIWSKGRMIWRHTDDATPVSIIKANYEGIKAEVVANTKTIKHFDKTLGKAVEELENVRRNLLSRTLHGRATREKGESVGENRIYVNTNSDARSFKYGENIEICAKGKAIRAFVRGTMLDKRQDVLCLINADAAQELGFTIREGITYITVKRVLKEKSGDSYND